MTIYRAGGETRVNTTTPGDQFRSSVAGLADGGWIVTWTSGQGDGDGTCILQQRFSANGATVGPERLVNIATAGGQQGVNATALQDGGWLVTWQSPDAGNGGIFQQHFDANGVAAWTTDRQVNTVATGDQSRSKAIALPGGEWLVTWMSDGQDGDGFGIFQQRFDRSGNPYWAPEHKVNATVAGNQDQPTVAVLPDGGWVVAWTSIGQDGSGKGIYQQRFDRFGVAASPTDRLVNAITPNDQDIASVTALADGGWVIVWTSKDQDGSGFGVYQQRYDRTGAAAAPSDRLVNVVTADDQFDPKTVALPDGGWVIVWTSTGQDGDSYGVFQQVFDRNGNPASATDTLVNSTTAKVQFELSAAALLDGGWVVSWTSAGVPDGQDGSGSGIYQQRFLPSQAPKDVKLSGQPVAEAAAAGTVVGALSAVDANLAFGDAVSYTLLDNSGGRFALQGGSLVVADPLKLDYEQASAHVVTVRATDKDGLFLDRALTIAVADVARESVGGGTGADRLVGGADRDTFKGLAGDDVLIGGAGADALFGGLGKDTLTGGTGRDLFVFDSAIARKKNANVDRILDFVVKDDTFELDNAIYKALGRKGSATKPAALDRKMFWTGVAAHDGDDHLIYNRKTGVLFYDDDGTGGHAQIQIAILTRKPALTDKDFLVI